jgi:hypothetical protein
LPSGDEVSFPKRKSGKKNYGMSVTLADKRPFYITVKNWVARFRTGHLSTEDKQRSERPTQATIPENLVAIHSMMNRPIEEYPLKDSRDPSDIPK